MNLEEIEEKALLHLGQVTNPLVRIGSFYARLRAEIDLGEFSLQDFHSFLDRHELVRVVNGVALDPDMESSLQSADLAMGECAMLKSRVPTESQMAVMMVAQLESLQQALGTALAEAHERRDAARVHSLQESLKRLESIRRRFGDFLASEQS